MGSASLEDKPDSLFCELFHTKFFTKKSGDALLDVIHLSDSSRGVYVISAGTLISVYRTNPHKTLDIRDGCFL